MSRWFRVLLTTLFLPFFWLPGSSSALAQSSQPTIRAVASAPALRVSVQPPKINVGRDVSLKIRVTDSKGKPVAGALVTITGVSRPMVGKAPHGTLTLKVRALALGTALVQVSRTGYAPVTYKAPIVPGPPAAVTAIKKGMSVLAPHGKPVPGKVGTDLFEQYHGMTGKGQYASLGLRDGTLIDLNANTDVVIHDPLHVALSKGELFLEVVHGAVSHQVQVGTTVAATKGTRLDVKVNAKNKAAVVTVVEGQVLVSNRKVSGTAGSVLVGAGQQSTVVGSKPPSPPKPVNLNKLLSWVQNLPNTNKTTVPPVLNLPPPRLSPIPSAPPAATPRITVTGTLASAVWTASAGPYLLTGGVTLPAGATLSIAPGTLVEMGSYAYLYVQGTLKAQGTAAAPIVFTSAAAQPKPGDWQYIRFDGPRASASVLDYVQVFYGSPNGAANGMVAVTQSAAPTITHCLIAHATRIGIWVDTGRPTITDCTFRDNGGPAISLPAKDPQHVHDNTFAPGQKGMEIR
ncbi:MAG: FecR domain-containing protein [Chloroflexota bacterium]